MVGWLCMCRIVLFGLLRMSVCMLASRLHVNIFIRWENYTHDIWTWLYPFGDWSLIKSYVDLFIRNHIVHLHDASHMYVRSSSINQLCRPKLISLTQILCHLSNIFEVLLFVYNIFYFADLLISLVIGLLGCVDLCDVYPTGRRYVCTR